MLSSDFPSALIPRTSSVPAAISRSAAANAYPALTRQAESGLDKPSEQERRRASANRGAECVEAGDSQCTGLEREDLAGSQIGRTCRRRGKEEDRKPGDRLRQRSEESRGEEIGGEQQQKAADGKRSCDHRLAADGVEQRSKKQGPAEISDGERKKIYPDPFARYLVEMRENEAEREEYGIVKKRL